MIILCQRCAPKQAKQALGVKLAKSSERAKVRAGPTSMLVNWHGIVFFFFKSELLGQAVIKQ